MRRIGTVTGTRAEYGLSRTIFRAIDAHLDLELAIIVTGMHLMEEFGYSYRLIQEDGFEIAYNTGVTQRDDTTSSMAVSFGENVIAITQALEKIKPDIMLVLTDLGHALAGAIAAAHLNIPVAHLHGGDVSGSIDELIRHATTKFSHIHFPASELSAERIIKMGEDPGRVFMFGAPGVDDIKSRPLIRKKTLYKKYHLSENESFIILVQHAVTTEGDAITEIEETVAAIKSVKMRTIIIFPNTDAGGAQIIRFYEKLKSEQYIDIYRNIPRRDYLSLMKHAACMVGNSSSGIIEAPYFRLPVVNIGTRQRDRQRARNVIDVDPDSGKISKGIKKALSQEFVATLDRMDLPYGEGGVGENIARVLAKTKLDNKLLNKSLAY